MYSPPLPTEITLPLEPNDDPELTCMACKQKRTCELVLNIRFPGYHQWWGIHIECVEAIRLKPK